MDTNEGKVLGSVKIDKVVGPDDVLTIKNDVAFDEKGNPVSAVLEATVESKYCTCTGTLWYKDSYGKVTCSKCKKLIEGFDMPSPEKLIGAERVELLKKYGYEIVDNN